VGGGVRRLQDVALWPVVALSQLSRPDRTNANWRPTMSDLRESSQLENDAHCIVLAHREWGEEYEKLKSGGELIVAKQRSGETGAFQINYDKRTLTFGDAPAAAQRMAKALMSNYLTQLQTTQEAYR
jgi:replicative DNA helicase